MNHARFETLVRALTGGALPRRALSRGVVGAAATAVNFCTGPSNCSS